MAKASSYTASDIEVLEGLEPVRRRPGMYIGGTDGPAGLHHLVKEILDNSIDEAMNGHASQVSLTLEKDGLTVTIEDNGRGIPVDVHPKFKKPAVELLLTTLHSGGKFSAKNYSSAGGLHGVGASVVNALSDELTIHIVRDGYEWDQRYARGVPQTKLIKGKASKKTGTRVSFRADPTLFKEVEFQPKRLEQIVREKAFLNRGLEIQYHDLTTDKHETFKYDEGVKAYVKALLLEDELEAVGSEIFSFDRANGTKVEIAFCWTTSTSEKIKSYVNGIYTPQGGTHEDGFRNGLVKSLRNYMQVHEMIPKGTKIGAEDIREGLVAVVSIVIPGEVSELQFQGQTKDRLNNPEAGPPVEGLMRGLENTLNANPNLAKIIVERALLASRARAAARTAVEGVRRKGGASLRLNLPGKLADCSSRGAENSEIFIVEGDSAGGTAKQARDRHTQAILPLKGKILNVIPTNDGRLKDNKELSDLVSALGCGIGSDLRLERLRYNKVVILTDADADGMHIASLLMAFFFRYMKPLIDNGNLFIAMCPLYRIKVGSGSKEEFQWAFSDAERDKLLAKLSRRTVQVTRFKGLGEMNPSTLWETTLNPKTRQFLRVKSFDAKKDEDMLVSLLGKESSERYRLIQEYAPKLELDV